MEIWVINENKLTLFFKYFTVKIAFTKNNQKQIAAYLIFNFLTFDINIAPTI